MHRRRLLVGLVAVVASACGLRRDDEPGAAPPPAPPSDPPAAPPPVDDGDDPDPTSQVPPTNPPYEVSPNETHPNAKALGAAIAQALTTYEPDETLEQVVARATDGAFGEGDRDNAGPLVHDGLWSRGQVVYPQFGGLTRERCSIMAVVRQTIGDVEGSTVRTEIRTLDVRLRIVGGAWRFEELRDTGGEPVDRPDDLSDEATAVLDDDRIVLPDSARWDIHEGETSDELLALMTRLADHTGGYEVCTLRRGHPVHVFGTDRVSDHTRGRAVDLHRIGERLVIDDRASGSPTLEALSWLYGDPAAPNLGGPVALDGFGGRSFTDAVHQDHLHIAVPRAQDRGEIPDEELAPD